MKQRSEQNESKLDKQQPKLKAVVGEVAKKVSARVKWRLLKNKF